MKNFKKILIPVLASILMLLLCTLTSCGMFGSDGIDLKKEAKSHEAFIEELGGVSDTYVGSVSDYSYPSAEYAANAYASDYIGSGLNSVISTSSVKTLDNEEIAQLKLSAEDSEGLEAVELFEVVVSTNEELCNESSSEFALLDTLNTTKTVKVYIIKYANDFKYFSPCPVTGETITKSYYDSVFNSEKYQNCTYTTTSTVENQVTVLGFIKVNVDVVTNQVIKFAENAIYIEQTTKTSMPGGENTEQYAYVWEDEDGLSCYISTDGKNWNPGSLTSVGFRTLEELTPFHDQYLSYTYFTKTDYGFQLAEENSKQYVNQALSGIDKSDFSDFEVELFAKYYVCEGTLSGIRSEVHLDFTMSSEETNNQSVNANAVALTEMKISECGTTVVELPVFD